MTCGKLIQCWDYLKRPCLRAAGHTPGLCNPFSENHPWEPEPKASTPTQLYEQVLQAAGLTSNKIAA